MSIDKIRSYLEIVTNVGVLSLSILLVFAILRGLNTTPQSSGSKQPAGSEQTFRLDLPDSLKNGQPTFVLALDTRCRFCVESRTFYRRVAESNPPGSKLQIVALFPNSSQEAQRFLDEANVRLQHVIANADFRRSGISVTPTLFLLEGDGRLKKHWSGKLTFEEEVAVSRLLGTSIAENQ